MPAATRIAPSATAARLLIPIIVGPVRSRPGSPLALTWLGRDHQVLDRDPPVLGPRLVGHRAVDRRRRQRSRRGVVGVRAQDDVVRYLLRVPADLLVDRVSALIAELEVRVLE